MFLKISICRCANHSCPQVGRKRSIRSVSCSVSLQIIMQIRAAFFLCGCACIVKLFSRNRPKSGTFPFMTAGISPSKKFEKFKKLAYKNFGIFKIWNFYMFQKNSNFLNFFVKLKFKKIKNSLTSTFERRFRFSGSSPGWTFSVSSSIRPSSNWLGWPLSAWMGVVGVSSE